MNTAQLKVWLSEQEAVPQLEEMITDLLGALPKETDFDSDVWNILPWLTTIGRKRVCNIYFDDIVHSDLKILCKLWVLHNRLTKRTSSLASANFRIRSCVALSHSLGARDFKKLKTDDFYTAEEWFKTKFDSAYRTASVLQQASKWIGTRFRIRLDYKCRIHNPIVHGRYGTEKGRQDKLVPNEVLRDMLAARHRSNLSDKDRFYLWVLAILISTGLRIGELTTLRADCILKLDGKLHLLLYPKKGGRPVPRPIHSAMAEVVEDAINQLLEFTSEAREVAKGLREHAGKLDWPRIIEDHDAFRYFTAQWAHEWTSQPNNQMINPNGAWYKTRNCFINVIGEIQKAGSKSQAARNLGIQRPVLDGLLAAQNAAQRGELAPMRNGKDKRKNRTSYDTDQRMLSILKLEKYCDLVLKSPKRLVIQDIITDAQASQLRGEVYPAPPFNGQLEESFKRQIVPLLRDTNGNAVLYPDEALLVIQKYALSHQRSTKIGNFSSISDRDISSWLTGESRSRGTGNHEDSVFVRLGIVDPNTGEVAHFTSHDVRHWLNTLYQNGGLTEDQIALIFNRKYKKQNATYDQTSNQVRVERLKAAIRSQTALGQVAETYSTLLADYTRDEADEYLEGMLRIANPMPHGVCTLHWASTPCPHHLSCFSCEDEKPCENLVLDAEHEGTVVELKRLQRESDLTVGALLESGVEDSPTLDHFKRIKRNVTAALENMNKISASITSISKEGEHEEIA